MKKLIKSIGNVSKRRIAGWCATITLALQYLNLDLNLFNAGDKTITLGMIAGAGSFLLLAKDAQENGNIPGMRGPLDG